MMNSPSRRFRLPHGFQIRDSVIATTLDKENMIVGSTSAASNSAMWLGRLAEYQRMETNVWLDLQGAHSIYVMGKRRSGKTFTLGALVEGLVGIDSYSSGAVDQMVVVLDTMNVFLTSRSSAMRFNADDLTEWGLQDPADIPFDLFYPSGTTPPPVSIGAQPFTIPPFAFSVEDWCELFALDPFSDPMGQLIGEALDRVTENGFTTDAGLHLATNAFSLETLILCVEEAVELLNFDDSTRRALGRRFRAQARTNLFGEYESRLGSAGRASIFLLRDLDPELRRLFVSYVTASLLRDRAATESVERILPTLESNSEESSSALTEIENGMPRAWLIIDEAHNYIPAQGGGRCRRLLNRYVTEGRNLGLSIVVATQYPSALDPALKRNSDILIIHTLSMQEDIDVAQSMLTTAIPNNIAIDNAAVGAKANAFQEATRRMPRGFCFLSNDTLSRLVPVAVRPRVTYHGGASY